MAELALACGSVTAASIAARNDPRMASNLSSSLSTTSAIISNIAPRTRSCADESCSRNSTSSTRRRHRAGRVASTATIPTMTASPASLRSVASGSALPVCVKNIDSTTIEPNSATEHAAMTYRPVVPWSRRASLRTGATMPSDVYDRTIATSSGSMMTSAHPSG
jgi:hypothetical protein